MVKRRLSAAFLPPAPHGPIDARSTYKTLNTCDVWIYLLTFLPLQEFLPCFQTYGRDGALPQPFSYAEHSLAPVPTRSACVCARRFPRLAKTGTLGCAALAPGQNCVAGRWRHPHLAMSYLRLTCLADHTHLFSLLVHGRVPSPSICNMLRMLHCSRNLQHCLPSLLRQVRATPSTLPHLHTVAHVCKTYYFACCTLGCSAAACTISAGCPPPAHAPAPHCLLPSCHATFTPAPHTSPTYTF